MEVLADPSLRFLGILGKGSQTGEDRATSNDDIVLVRKLAETPFTKDVEGSFKIIEVSSHRRLAVCATFLFWCALSSCSPWTLRAWVRRVEECAAKTSTKPMNGSFKFGFVLSVAKRRRCLVSDLIAGGSASSSDTPWAS